MIYLVALLTLLGGGVLLVVHGTVTKNRWGVNLRVLSCPRCGARPRQGRLPRTLQQVAWGGWTCAVCGAELDKWGREIASTAFRHSTKLAAERRPVFKKRFAILIALVYFCLTLLLDWTGLTDGGFPVTGSQAFFQVGAAIVETAIFTILFSLAMRYIVEWFFHPGKGN